ncbi:MAG: DUF1084 domain-containing protein [archaeon]|nr:DUF1084 domain-containing protein [archaeon]
MSIHVAYSTLLDVNLAFCIVLFCFDSLLVLVGLVAIGYTLVVQHEEGEWRVTHSMIVIAPLPILLRICYLAAHFSQNSGPYLSEAITQLDVDSPLFLITATMPFFLLLALYSLLIIFWIGLYYREKRVRSYWLANWKWLCLAFNAAIAAIWVGFMVAIPLLASASDQRILAASEAVFEVALSLVMAGFFVCYVPLVVRQLGQRSQEALPIPRAVKSIRQIRTRILVAAVVATISLLLRSVLVLLRVFLLESDPVGNLITSILEYILCETLPIAIILFFIILPEDLRRVVPSLANPLRKLSQRIRTSKSPLSANPASPRLPDAKGYGSDFFASTPYILNAADESGDWESDRYDSSHVDFDPF